jgi:hypothetical protein
MEFTFRATVSPAILPADPPPELAPSTLPVPEFGWTPLLLEILHVGSELRERRTRADAAAWPVRLVANSYGFDFREHLIRELNLQIRTRIAGNSTAEAFGDLLRAPELLDGVRVVVWVTTEQHFARFKPLPEPVAVAGR